MQHLILHIGQGSTEIKKTNKNLYRPVASSGSIYGISYTIDKNGAVTLNGTATASADIYIINSSYNNQIKDVELKTLTTQVANSDFSLHVGLGNSTFARDTFTPQDGQYIVTSFIRVPSGTVCNNLVVYPQIEFGSKKTPYKKYQEDSKILYIQQEMLDGDYFVKEENGWKEVHNVGYYKFTGDENFKKRGVYNNLNVFYLEGADVPFMYKLQSYAKSGISTAFKTAKSISYSANNTIEEGIQLYYNSTNLIRAFYISVKDIETVEDLKAKIKEIDFDYYYTAEEPTKLACTEEQSAVLDELNNLNLFDGVNNIITAENIAKLKLKYVADTKTYVDNQVNERLSNIENQIINLSGGN